MGIKSLLRTHWFLRCLFVSIPRNVCKSHNGDLALSKGKIPCYAFSLKVRGLYLGVGYYCKSQKPH